MNIYLFDLSKHPRLLNSNCINS